MNRLTPLALFTSLRLRGEVDARSASGEGDSPRTASLRFPLTPGIIRYPSGGLGHTAIDAALELRPMVPLSEIAGVEVAITKLASRRYTTTYPQSTEAAKFSAPYLAAYTLIHGAPMVAAFTEEALHDEAVRTLARKVSVAIYQEHADLLEESPAKVTLTLRDGRKIERSKYYPTGAVQVPMTAAQIEEKFTACATTVVKPDAAKKIFAMLGALGEQKSFDEFSPEQRPGLA